MIVLDCIQHADYPPAQASLQAGLSGCATVPLSPSHRKRGVGYVQGGCGERGGVSLHYHPFTPRDDQGGLLLFTCLITIKYGGQGAHCKHLQSCGTGSAIFDLLAMTHKDGCYFGSEQDF